jgi:hypothetical protein
LFGRNKNKKKNGESKSIIKESESGEREKRRKIPFFGRSKKSKEKEEGSEEQTVAAASVNAATLESPESTKPKKKDPPSADDLRLMAERARLEAERLDAELTLSKIEKLEQQLLKSKKDGTSETSVDDLQHELDVLQAKLKGEPTPVKPAATVTAPPTKKPSESSTLITSTATSATLSSPNEESLAPNQVRVVEKQEVTRTDAIDEIDNAKVLEAAAIIAESEEDFFSDIRTYEEIQFIPEFIVKVIAPFYGLKNDGNGKIDRKELLRRGNMAKELDYSFFDNVDPPTFDRSEIRKRKLAILKSDKSEKGLSSGMAELVKEAEGRNDEGNNINPMTGGSMFGGDVVTVTKNMLRKADGNATQLALYSLEYDYYFKQGFDDLFTDTLLPTVNDLLQNATYFGSMYPKCVVNRGENNDDYVSEEPTEAQMSVLTQTILPAIKFSSSSKPQKVPGGYAITGSHKYEDGDALIAAIDQEIAKSRPNLVDQLTVLYTPSYGPLTAPEFGDLNNMDANALFPEPDVLELFAETEPILYVTGPNIVRDSNPLGLAFASILGLATSWYLSVYPFLLNDKIASRIDGDLQLVEANLQPDLSYLTDLSIPLFLTFMGIQLVHEVAHRLTAMFKNVKLSVPVFVPSLITGVTSTVTTFKTLPKNKNDMFDISAAGPLAGIIVSSVALALGSKLTLVSDPATLPALPLDILRQSTLGGAIIDQIITGSLYVPDGAPTAGITIPLHPFAIAGYVGLIVNALALLPVGSEYSKRVKFMEEKCNLKNVLKCILSPLIPFSQPFLLPVALCSHGRW